MVDRSDAIRLDLDAPPFAQQEAVRELLGMQPDINPKLGTNELEEIARAVIAQELGVDRNSLGILLTVENANATYDFQDGWKPNLSAASASERENIASLIGLEGLEIENTGKLFLAKSHQEIIIYNDENIILGENARFQLNIKLDDRVASIESVTYPVSANECCHDEQYPHNHTVYNDGRELCCKKQELCREN